MKFHWPIDLNLLRHKDTNERFFWNFEKNTRNFARIAVVSVWSELLEWDRQLPLSVEKKFFVQYPETEVVAHEWHEIWRKKKQENVYSILLEI